MITWKIKYNDKILGEFFADTISDTVDINNCIIKELESTIYCDEKPSIICRFEGEIFFSSIDTQDEVFPHDSCEILWESEDHLVRRFLKFNLGYRKEEGIKSSYQ